MNRSTQFIVILTLRVNKSRVKLRKQSHHEAGRSRVTPVRLRHTRDWRYTRAGAVDKALRSSTHGRRKGHSDLLKLSLPEIDATQQAVCHSSTPPSRYSQ